MAVVTRYLLWSLVPVITTLVALITAIFTFVGSNETSTAVTKSIFFYGIDFSLVMYPLNRNNWTSVAGAAGMDPIFHIGASGFCHGNSSVISELQCETSSVPFWFDLRRIMASYGSEHIFDKTDALQQLEYLPFKVNSQCVWALLIVIIILSVICLTLFLWDIFHPLGAYSTVLLLGSVIHTACALTTAVLVLQNYTNLRNVLTAGTIRGITGLGLVWSMATMSTLTLAWWFISCCGRCHRALGQNSEVGNEGRADQLEPDKRKVDSSGAVSSAGYSVPVPQRSTKSANTRYNSFSSIPSLPDRSSSLSVSLVDMSHIGPQNAHKSPRSSRIDLTRGQTLQRRKERGLSQTPQVQLLNPHKSRIPELVDESTESCEIQRKVTMNKFKFDTRENEGG